MYDRPWPWGSPWTNRNGPWQSESQSHSTTQVRHWKTGSPLKRPSIILACPPHFTQVKQGTLSGVSSSMRPSRVSVRNQPFEERGPAVPALLEEVGGVAAPLEAVALTATVLDGDAGDVHFDLERLGAAVIVLRLAAERDSTVPTTVVGEVVEQGEHEVPLAGTMDDAKGHTAPPYC